MEPARRILLRQLAAFLLLPVAAASALALAGYVAGNGPTPGAFALAGPPVALLLARRLLTAPSRLAALSLLGLLGAEAAFAAARILAVDPSPAGLAFCEDDDCSAPGPLLARLVRERESTFAGIALSRTLGILDGPDATRMGAACDRVYDALDVLTDQRPAVNALLLASSGDRVRMLTWTPPGDGPFPTLVFLHGFGGLLTPYLSVLAATALGSRFAIVAPALDTEGAWWERRGRQVLERTLAHLPPQVDPSRLFLVGLSNGAVGATHLASDPALGSAFLATILLVGIGEAPGPLPHPVLVLPGTDDNRFPLPTVTALARALEDQGTDVTFHPTPGDHFTLFTHTDVLAAEIAAFTAAVEAGGAASPLAAHAAALEPRVPAGYSVIVEPPFVVVSQFDPAETRRLCGQLIRRTVRLLRQDFFASDPPGPIEIWLFADDRTFREEAAARFAPVPDTPFGFYSPEHRALVMNLATGGGTLVHEIVHPYVEANFAACPAWFNEGLGSLFEASAEVDGHIRGLPNWRLPALQEAIRSRKIPPFADLLATTTDAFYASDTAYAQARYLCLFLQEQGLLVPFYHAFLAHQATDPTGATTLWGILGNPDPAAFQARWEAWVLGLTWTR